MKYLRKFNESLEPKYTYTDLNDNINNINNIDITQLLSLNTEDVGVGDDVLVVYNKDGEKEYSIYRFTVEKIGDELGFNSGKTIYIINNSFSDAYLVVKVETYDDFASPELRIGQ